jgi:hypothetical protein
MALFTTKPSLADQLKAKSQAKIDNAVRLQSAEAALDKARVAVEACALDNDDAKLDKALSVKRVCEDKLAALESARKRLDAEHADIEAQLAHEADQKQRVATAASIDELITRWESGQQRFIETASSLGMVAREASVITQDAAGSRLFLEQCVEQLPAAGTVVCNELRNRAQAVLDGYARPDLPKPEPEPVRLKVVPASTRELVALKPIRWLDINGVMQCAGSAQRCVLPVALAETALAKNLAVPVGDKRVVPGIHGMILPSFENCIAIDGSPLPESEAKSNAPPVMASEPVFEKFDRGPPRMVKVPTQTSPADLMTGTRSAPDDGGES